MRKVKTVQKVPFLAPDVITKVIPPPTDGWDAISPLAAMDPKRAPTLVNWVPRPGFVEIRGGYVPYSNTGLGTAVETLMVFRTPTLEKMFAASASSIINVTSGDAPTTAVSSLSNGRWQYTNFTPLAGTNVIQCVNGTDAMLQFDGSSWTTPSITGLPGGVTSANFIAINAQKRRLWYMPANSSLAIYMPTDAISGAIAGYIELGALWSKGGYVMAMASWTIDGGSGPQDYAMFISSRGQVTIYTGVDPTDATDWKLVGVFDIAPPIGRRCLLRVGSDVGVITQQGVVPISQALPFDPSADRSVAITARIQNAMAQASQIAKDNFGWQLISFPNQQLAILNVPYAENSGQQQFVMNALTGAWCNFTGWEANCFEIFNDKLYWGSNDGFVHQGYAGGADYTTAIAADMQCAYNWFEEPGRTKRMTMVQPLMNVGGSLTPTLAVDTDFQTSTAIAPVATITGGAQWDSAVWDVSLWPALTVNYANFLSVDALGHAMAIHLRVTVGIDDTIPYLGVFDVGQFDYAVFDSGFSPLTPILQVNAFNSILEYGGAI